MPVGKALGILVSVAARTASLGHLSQVSEDRLRPGTPAYAADCAGLARPRRNPAGGAEDRGCPELAEVGERVEHLSVLLLSPPNGGWAVDAPSGDRATKQVTGWTGSRRGVYCARA